MVKGFCRQRAHSVRSLHRLAKRLRNAGDVNFPCPNFTHVHDPSPKLPSAEDGFAAGSNVKTEEEASLLSDLFRRCGSARRFKVGDRRPSYPDYNSIKGALEPLDRERGCSKRQFLDSRGRKWSVKYNATSCKSGSASLINEEARLESSTACSVPSSTHINTSTSAAHIRGHCRHDVHGRVPRASLDTFATEDSPRSDQ